MFILKNIVSEKWSLEKSLSSLIRRVIQLQVLIFAISVVTCFRTVYQKFASFSMSKFQNYSLNFHQFQFSNGVICMILQRFTGKCRKFSCKSFHTFPKRVCPRYVQLVLGNTLM